jgi:hypothetical protein
VHIVLLAVTLDIIGPPVQSKEEISAERQTLSGALQRADQKMEWWNRGMNLARENYGTRGRINSTNRAADEAEQPFAVGSGFSEWQRW